MQISKNYQPSKRDPHLHSPAHVLADELASKLGDSAHFAYYLKTAMTVDHNVLRHILGGILEGKPTQSGALFAYLVKKYNREKNTTNGFSVWLVPNSQGGQQLNRVIVELAQTFDSPVFQPHIDLYAKLPEPTPEILEALEKITDPPLMLNFKAPVVEEEFFKSISLPVEKNKQLLAIKRNVKSALGITKAGTFNPYLSLLFGNIPDTDKQNAIKEHLVSHPTTLIFDRLMIVNTTGQSADWKVIKTITLKPS